MRPFSRSIIFALGLLMTTASVAQATDLCVVMLGETYVGKKFTIPPKNQCKPFNGFQQADNFFLTGMGCTSSDGTSLRLQFSATTLGYTLTLSASCSIPRASLSGGTCSGTEVFPSNAVEAFSASGVSASHCTVNVP